MIVSTRGRYAIRVMLDLASHSEAGYIPMKEVAERQNISLKYLEKIMPILVKNNMVEGVHGKGGGYRLTRTPEKYVIGEIVKLTEGDIAPVSCLECNSTPCEKKEECLTIPMWSKLNNMIGDFFDHITLDDLLNRRV